jgi:tetratricopeptide (TPR) repeat protein
MRFFALVFALSLAAPPAAAGLLEDAQAAFQQGDYVRAATLAERIREASPGDESARLFHGLALNALGVSLAEEEQWEQALNRLQQARRVLPDDEVVAENLHVTMINAAQHLAAEAGRHRQAWDLLGRLPEDLGEPLAQRRVEAAAFIQLLWARQFEHEGREDEQRQHLEAALAVDPLSVAALIDLGEWHYAQDNFDEAISHLRRALDLQPDLDVIRHKIRQIGRERRLMMNLVRERTEHFQISHPGPGAREFVTTCIQVLEEARARLSREFRQWPSRRIRVVIYREDQFRGVTLAPDWAQASFDGKIRVMVQEIETHEQRRALQDTLSHELTHAYVFDVAGPSCPVWLNEGLAQCFEKNFDLSRREEIQLRQWRDGGALVAIVDMPEEFAVIQSPDEAQRIYLECAAFASHLVRRFGAHRLRGVLEDLGEDMALDESLRSRLHHPLAELDQQWRRSL